jgi:hypothetical protein
MIVILTNCPVMQKCIATYLNDEITIKILFLCFEMLYCI